MIINPPVCLTSTAMPEVIPAIKERSKLFFSLAKKKSNIVKITKKESIVSAQIFCEHNISTGKMEIRNAEIRAIFSERNFLAKRYVVRIKRMLNKKGTIDA